MEYLHRLNGTDKLPFPFFEIGQWWDTNPKSKRQVKIDIVATYKQDKKALFGECKFCYESLDKAVLDILVENGEVLLI